MQPSNDAAENYIPKNLLTNIVGTDLKLPPHARAAVTLGPHLTKDALVQAAMRLRLLGKTQSVTFFSPPEVHQSILDLRAATKDRTHGSLSSFDVIRWLLEQTCNAIEQLEPLYFTQGINYLQRTQARLDYPDFIKDKMSRDMYLRVVRSKEMQTLKQLYEPKYHQRGPAVKASYFAPALQPHVKQVLQRKKDFQDRGFAIHATALEEVEQEREMEFEVESVREVQPPTHFKALKVSKLHHDIESFAIHGKKPHFPRSTELVLKCYRQSSSWKRSIPTNVLCFTRHSSWIEPWYNHRREDNCSAVCFSPIYQDCQFQRAE